jgi:predicted acylesterase/phospholipase RssA
MQQFDVVFEGGGAKGLALAGGLKALEQRGCKVRRMVGTSAGAMTAVNVAAGYTPDDLIADSRRKAPDGQPLYAAFADPPVFADEMLVTSDFGKLLTEVKLPYVSQHTMESVDKALLHACLKVPGMRSLFSLLERGGLHPGDTFIAWLKGTLNSRKPGLADTSFAEFHEHTHADLSVVVTDVTSRRMLVLNHRTAPNVPIVWAVRMSVSIPFYYTEVQWLPSWGRYLGANIDGHVMVDGGVVSNFPLHLFADPEDDEVRGCMGPAPLERARPLGFYLDASLPVQGSGDPPPPPPAHAGLISRINAILDTMMSAGDNAIVEAHREFVCRLPVQGYGTTEFNRTDARVNALFNAGVTATLAYLDGLASRT